MRTVSAIGSAVQRLFRRAAPVQVAAVRSLNGPRRALVTDALGEKRHEGAKLDQVDGTTCGSAVLVALATWADPAELEKLEVRETTPSGIVDGFAARYDGLQKRVHRQTNRLWPQALGTTPWAFAGWLRKHAPGVGRYRVRFVDDLSGTDVDQVIREIEAALGARRPVPLLVGAGVPRHYCLALRISDDGTWRVYEPSSATVRPLDPAAIRERRLAPILGFDRLHTAFLPR
ncbi:MAG: hypothetical protein JWP64_3652 [Pseudonocardia sp.]|jgi:hypothetical protein|nr:hypothetical protein [Pseudonocardia sp.]MDT7697865.1 hypothetical protein [Pseudonocardiales bacterium]HEV7469029.1 hypothetical protein [Pseudonocardia sp.]